MTPILVSYSGEQNSSLQGLVWTTTYEDTGLGGGLSPSAGSHADM